MYVPGHVGITLLLYVPLAVVLVALGDESEMFPWLLVSVVLTLLPDFDVFLPGLTHRGITHSLSAAVCLGVLVAVVGWASARSSPEDRVRRTAIGFLVGAGSVVSHLLGDVITPMGVRPFYPASRALYTLDLMYARNVEANLAFLAIGFAAFSMVYRWSRVRAETPHATADDFSPEPVADVDDDAARAELAVVGRRQD